MENGSAREVTTQRVESESFGADTGTVKTNAGDVTTPSVSNEARGVLSGTICRNDAGEGRGRSTARALPARVLVSSVRTRIEDVLESADLLRIHLEAHFDKAIVETKVETEVKRFITTLRMFKTMFENCDAVDEPADTNLSFVRLAEHRWWTETHELLTLLYKKALKRPLSLHDNSFFHLRLHHGQLRVYSRYFYAYCYVYTTSPPKMVSVSSHGSLPKATSNVQESVADAKDEELMEEEVQPEEPNRKIVHIVSDIPQNPLEMESEYSLPGISPSVLSALHVSRILPELQEGQLVVEVILGEKAAKEQIFFARKLMVASCAFNSSWTRMRRLWWATFVPWWIFYDLKRKGVRRVLERRYYLFPEQTPEYLQRFLRIPDQFPMNLLTRIALPSVRTSRPFILAMAGAAPVPCRFIAPFVHSFPSDGSEKSGTSTLVIHFHGGGFTALGSRFHEFYTRIWSRLSGLPIISVDYRLCPEQVYPAALEDCFHAYLWVLDKCESLGIGTRRIVLVGDSTGGNLATAVTLKAIACKLRVPDRLVLAYPLLNMTAAMTPSRIRAVEDPLVCMSVFDMLQTMYLRGQSACNPLVSPLFASNEMLGQFPETFISVGGMDPLLDDSIMFAYRLRENGAAVRLAIYPELSHGYLNLAPVMSAAQKPMNHLAKSLGKAFRDDERPRTR